MVGTNQDLAFADAYVKGVRNFDAKAAYAAADFIGDPDTSTEHPLPAIQAGAVLHLQPGGYQLLMVPIGRGVLEAFLAALAVFRFTTDLAPNLLPTPDPSQPQLDPERR